MKNRQRNAGLALLLWLAVPLACSGDERNFLSEGSVEDPVDLGEAATTYSGTVGGGGASYYRVNAAENHWQFAISNIDGDPDLEVFDDDGFTNLRCESSASGTAPESCDLECLGGCDFFLRVTGVSARGASYNLSVSPFVQ